MTAAKSKTPPPPLLLTAFACERMIVDGYSKRPSAIGMIDMLGAPAYPAACPTISFYCALTNGQGMIQIGLRLVDPAHGNHVLYEKTGERQFNDVHEIVHTIFNVLGIYFPHPGEYRFQIYADGCLVGERGIICYITEEK